MIQSLLDTVKQQAEVLNNLPEDEALRAVPENEGWNAAQCIQHMNLATELYLDQIERKIAQLKPASGPYKPRYLAEKFIRGLGPDSENRIRYKMKTFKVFEPGDVAPAEAVSRLKKNLERITSVLKQSEGKDMRSFKVHTAFGPILQFYLGDALRFVTAHNARHFLQLERTLDSVTKSSVPS